MKMDLEGLGYKGVDLMYLARVTDQWWRVMNTVMINLKVLSNAGNFVTRWGVTRFSRRTWLHTGMWLSGK